MGAAQLGLQCRQPRYVRAHDRGAGILFRDRRRPAQHVAHRQVRVLIGLYSQMGTAMMNTKTKLTRRSLMGAIGSAGVASPLLREAGAQTITGTNAVAL